MIDLTARLADALRKLYQTAVQHMGANHLQFCADALAHYDASAQAAQAPAPVDMIPLNKVFSDMRRLRGAANNLLNEQWNEGVVGTDCQSEMASAYSETRYIVEAPFTYPPSAPALPAPGALAGLVWHDGMPPFPQDQEWFIAETTHGDRVVLRSLDEGREHPNNYAFTTADHTYMKAELVKRWMQFPDCSYLPPEAAIRAGGEPIDPHLELAKEIGKRTEVERQLRRVQSAHQVQATALGSVMEEIESLRQRLNDAQMQINCRDNEIGAFQDSARDVMVAALNAAGLPGFRIDGGGSDSGDWRDFTMAEIRQGIWMATEAVDDLHKQLAAKEASLSEVIAANRDVNAACMKEAVAVDALRGRLKEAALTIQSCMTLMPDGPTKDCAQAFVYAAEQSSDAGAM